MFSASEKFIQLLRHAPFQLALSAEDVEGIHSMPITERFYPAGILLTEEGEPRRTDLFISSGWALSYKSTTDGQRVVTDFLQRGDFVASNAILGKAHQSTRSVTDVVALEIDTHRSRLPEKYHHVFNIVTHLMARNYDILIEHIVNISRRRPADRLSFLFLEAAYRHKQAGLSTEDHYTFPFTQGDLADSLGVTSIHVNRLLRILRERELVRFRQSKVELLDRERLVKMTKFDPGYLEMPFDLRR